VDKDLQLPAATRCQASSKLDAFKGQIVAMLEGHPYTASKSPEIKTRVIPAAKHPQRGWSVCCVRRASPLT